MNPKEKAFKLIEYFTTLLPYYSQEDNLKKTKKCALIAVYEVIKETKLHDLTIYQHGRTAYWEEVKKEIEKL